MLLTASETVRPRRRRFRLARRPLGFLTLASVLFIGAVMGVLAWADRATALAGADRTSQVLALAFERHVGRTLAEIEGALVMIGDGLPLVQAERKTVAWFGIRLGPATFGIFDAFPDEDGRNAHLAGKVAAALMATASELFASPPSIEKVDVLAAKLP